MTQNSIEIYQTADGQTSIEVTLENETLWLNQAQIAALFGTKRPAITKHLSNIFRSGELVEDSVCSKMEHTAKDGKNYQTQFYNLDAILSIGYRVNSKNATQFRIWANKILRDFLVRGYAINEKRLKEQADHLAQLKKAITLIGEVVHTKSLSSDEATGLLQIIRDYSYALETLDRYDRDSLAVEAINPEELFIATYDAAKTVITELKKKFADNTLFGNEKDQSFKSSLAAIYQSFNGEDVYPSIEEKAANLLYFIVKNHSFSDGNKRIGAFLFIWFLEKNALLYRPDKSMRVAANTLVALTLLIAQSKPGDKILMTRLVVNLINGNN